MLQDFIKRGVESSPSATIRVRRSWPTFQLQMAREMIPHANDPVRPRKVWYGLFGSLSRWIDAFARGRALIKAMDQSDMQSNEH